MKPNRVLTALICLAMLANAAEGDTDIKLGARLAYNGSTAIFEGKNYGLGHGAELGIIANIPIAGFPFEVSIGANGIYRKPYTKEIIDPNGTFITSELIEYAGSIPVMLKYSISNFYAQAGAQVDVPLKKEQKTTKGAEETYGEVAWRADRDICIALGLGWNINENFALDIKAVGGISEFNKEIGGYKLIQGSLGISYFFLKDFIKIKKAEPKAEPAAVAKAPAQNAEDPSENAGDLTAVAKAELEAAAEKWMKGLESSPNTDNFTFETSDGESGYYLRATSKVQIGDCPAKSTWEIGYEGCERWNNIPKDCKDITPKVITDYEGDDGC